MSDRYVTTNGIRLHYLDHSGPGPVLVLAPGLTANAHSFDGLVRAGLSDVARVIALDLRGRGESDAPPSGYTMEDHARDVLGLLDALGLERIVMGGHSFGGLLTYWLAANYPERIDRCVVLDAPVVVDSAVVDQIAPALARLGRVYTDWEEYAAHVQALPYFDEGGWDTDVERYFRADVRFAPDGTVQARPEPEHMREAIEGTVGVDWPRVVERVAQPVLLLRAPASFGPLGAPPILSREAAETTATAMADCRLVDGIGNHFTFLFGRGAGVLTDAVASFLVEAPARAMVPGANPPSRSYDGQRR